MRLHHLTPSASVTLAHAGPPDKRPRTNAGPPTVAPRSLGTFNAMGDTEEQELLELAMASQPASQGAAATTAAARAAPSSYAAFGASEAQELAELAATTQPSPTRGTAGGSVRGGGAAAAGGRGRAPAVGAVEVSIEGADRTATGRRKPLDFMQSCCRCCGHRAPPLLRHC